MIRFFVRILFLLSSILLILRLIHVFNRFSRIQKRNISRLMVYGRLLIRVLFSVLRLLAFSEHHESVPIFSHSSKINKHSESGSIPTVMHFKTIAHMLSRFHASTMLTSLLIPSHLSSNESKASVSHLSVSSRRLMNSMKKSRNMDSRLWHWSHISNESISI